MKPVYLVSSEQYAQMAAKFYEEYLNVLYLEKQKELFSDPDFMKNLQMALQLARRKDDAFVGAVVFQAMAIESYVNLMGAYLTDEATYYMKSKGQPVDWKLIYIAKSINKEFPKELRKRINNLFVKRNKLVHQKPRSFSFDLLHDDEETINNQKEKFWKELSFGLDGLKEDEMTLYKELKDAVKTMRNAKYELLDEIRLNDEGEK